MATVSGVVKDSVGAFVSKLVRVYRRDTGAYVGQSVSNADTGAWSVTTTDTSEHFALVHDGVVDPLWTSVVLAMPFETNLTCYKGRVASASGGAAVTSGYLVLDGSGDYITLDGSGTLAPGTGRFCLEMRVKPTALAVEAALYDSRPAGTNGWYISLFSTTTGAIKVFANSADRIVSSAGVLAVGVETHIELDRDVSGNWKLFADGVQVGSTYTDANSYLNGASRPAIGANGASLASSQFNGRIRSLRVTTQERHTTTFTPPAFGEVVQNYGGVENALVLDRLVPV